MTGNISLSRRYFYWKGVQESRRRPGITENRSKGYWARILAEAAHEEDLGALLAVLRSQELVSPYRSQKSNKVDRLLVIRSKYRTGFLGNEGCRLLKGVNTFDL